MKCGMRLLLIAAVAAIDVHAQSAYLFCARTWEMRVDVSDRAFANAGLSLKRRFTDTSGTRGAYLAGGVQVPVVLEVVSGAFNDFSTFVAGGTGRYFGRRCGAGVAARLFLDRQKHVLGTNLAWGFELKGNPFVRLRRCIVGLDLQWRQVVAMHIQNSGYVDATFTGRYLNEKGPRDGWYSSPATRLSSGICFGAAVHNRVTVDLSAGIKFSPSKYRILMEGMMFGQIPFYANLGVGVLL